MQSLRPPAESQAWPGWSFAVAVAWSSVPKPSKVPSSDGAVTEFGPAPCVTAELGRVIDPRCSTCPCGPACCIVLTQKVWSTMHKNSVGSTASTGTGPSLAKNSYPVSGPYFSPPADTSPLIWNKISIEGC